MYCAKCGTRHNANFCPNCGTPATTGNLSRAHAPSGLRCPRCGSNNVNVQIAQTKEVHSGRGILWGLGRAVLVVCTLGLWLLVGRSKGKSRIKNEAFAVCQNCGKKWKTR